MRIPLKQWLADNGITSVFPSIRENTNSYPYVTFLKGSGDDSAQNIYFSVKASAQVSAGQDIKSIAKDLYVVPTENASGEARLKLSFKGDSTYMDVSELF